jgi:dTDP-4-dehydrorhamnose reductase
MKRVLILGCTGLIGHKLFQQLQQSEQITLFGVSKTYYPAFNNIVLNVTDFSALEALIFSVKPDVVVNCIGKLVEYSEDNLLDAIYFNSQFPLLLSGICKNNNIRFIHLSTDCVFSGINNLEGYTEKAEPNGFTNYARTKALGENIDENQLVIRTSVIGPELKANGTEFFGWILRQNAKVFGYKKAIWSGVTSLVLAEAIQEFIYNDINGIYHLTNNSNIIKSDIIKFIKDSMGLNFNLICIDGLASDKTMIDTRKLLRLNVPPYEVMFKKMIENTWIDKDIYTHHLTNASVYK